MRCVVRRLLYRFYWALERLLTPGLKSSQYAYSDELSSQLSLTTQARGVRPAWLDLGCGHQVFGAWMTTEQHDVIAKCRFVCGVDADWNGLTKHAGIHSKVAGDLARLPFRAQSFDTVSCNMVAEHLSDPIGVLREIHRVLRSGGTFVFHTPNLHSWHVFVMRHTPDVLKKPAARILEGRKAEDVFKTHYLLNRTETIEEAASQAGFDVEVIAHVSTSAMTALLAPLAVAELLYLRALSWPSLATFRSNLVVRLRKV